MIIICEGLDNVGKGTQIANIRNHFYPEKQFHILHYGGVKSSETPEVQLEYNKIYYNEMFRILSMLDQANMHVILDRSHLGEWVYGPMYRNYDPSYIWDLEDMFKFKAWWNDTYLIHFTSSPETVIKRDDGFSFTTDLDKKQEELDLFQDSVNLSRIKNKISINIDGLNKDQVFAQIKIFLEKK